MKRSLATFLTACCVASASFADDSAAGAFLPTPYSAEQIRDAWQPGLLVEMRTSGEKGEALRRMSVLAADTETCTVRSEPLGPDGSPSGEPGVFTARWSELRDHARFEAAKASRERAECHSGLGALPGWRYATTAANGDALSMCFADATPGPPVEVETRREGELLSRTEHTRYERPSGAKEKP
jgi:hypothetical protein